MQYLSYVKKELSDYSRLMILLLKGKGSLSDYLAIAIDFSLGVLLGYVVWG